MLEVVEHVYSPRDYARTVFDLLAEGGTAILSTPYHGYWKNLALALTGRMDAHFDPLWDHGHIKFWSMRTLGELLRETGFVDVRFERVGRVAPTCQVDVCGGTQALTASCNVSLASSRRSSITIPAPRKTKNVGCQ